MPCARRAFPEAWLNGQLPDYTTVCIAATAAAAAPFLEQPDAEISRRRIKRQVAAKTKHSRRRRRSRKPKVKKRERERELAGSQLKKKNKKGTAAVKMPLFCVTFWLLFVMQMTIAQSALTDADRH